MAKMKIGNIALASLTLAGAAFATFWAVRNPEKAKKAFDSAKDTIRVAGAKVADVVTAVPGALAASKMNGAEPHPLDA